MNRIDKQKDTEDLDIKSPLTNLNGPKILIAKISDFGEGKSKFPGFPSEKSSEEFCFNFN